MQGISGGTAIEELPVEISTIGKGLEVLTLELCI